MVGEWGYGLLENDIALDVQLIVQDLKKRLEFNLYQCTCEILKNKSNLETNEVVLAIAELELDECGNIKHVDETVKALKRELEDEVLNSWGNPEKRKKALLDFANNAKIKL